MAYMGIPIGLDLGRRDGAPVVYDARDIYVQARNIARLPAPARRLFGAAERRWARRANRVMTVNRPYAEVLARSFGVPLPAIVMNCSYRRIPPDVPPRRLHEALGLEGSKRIALYHGGLAPDRGIEQLIATLPDLPADVHLCLLGYGLLEASLEAHAADPSLAGRLHVLPAVPPVELLDWVASADVVAMPIQPSTLNHRLTTPNKLFEAMAVGVPVVASDLPGMATIVRETGCGVLCDPTDPRSIAAAIRSILEAPAEERAAIRDRALAAAAGPYSWEAQVDVLLAEYERLTERPW
jgi:glycosyltransferase involved in cell wall biosynthesis